MLLGHTNVDTYNTDWLDNYGGIEACLDGSDIANIFSIPALKNLGYHITYDNDYVYYLVTNRKTGLITKFI